MKTKKWTGDMVKSLRKRFRLDQRSFAELMQCRQQTVSEWETGKYKPGRAFNYILSDIEKRLEKRIR